MHILVLFTGGTIGSSLQAGYVAPDSAAPKKLIDDFFQHEPNAQVRFTTSAPYDI